MPALTTTSGAEPLIEPLDRLARAMVGSMVSYYDFGSRRDGQVVAVVAAGFCRYASQRPAWMPDDTWAILSDPDYVFYDRVVVRWIVPDARVGDSQSYTVYRVVSLVEVASTSVEPPPKFKALAELARSLWRRMELMGLIERLTESVPAEPPDILEQEEI